MNSAVNLCDAEAADKVFSSRATWVRPASRAPAAHDPAEVGVCRRARSEPPPGGVPRDGADRLSRRGPGPAVV
ncbi:hypothetical protein DLE01_09100, partial [Streptomyces sp. FT05W]